MKLMIMSAAMMSSMAFSPVMYDKAKDVTGGIVQVYNTAASIEHTGTNKQRNIQEKDLFKVADRMTPFAKEYGNAADPYKLVR